MSGTVIYAQFNDGGYGNMTVIDHGGSYATAYAHQSKLGVSVGQKVTQGQVIGYEGSTGFSTGPHVHFEIRVDGTAQNPRNFLSGQP
jgi:murein DD-endopeptidase MepM/ murein hydrolase activator NlpD